MTITNKTDFKLHLSMYTPHALIDFDGYLQAITVWVPGGRAQETIARELGHALPVTVRLTVRKMNWWQRLTVRGFKEVVA